MLECLGFEATQPESFLESEDELAYGGKLPRPPELCDILRNWIIRRQLWLLLQCRGRCPTRHGAVGEEGNSGLGKRYDENANDADVSERIVVVEVTLYVWVTLASQ